MDAMLSVIGLPRSIGVVRSKLSLLNAVGIGLLGGFGTALSGHGSGRGQAAIRATQTDPQVSLGLAQSGHLAMLTTLPIKRV